MTEIPSIAASGSGGSPGAQVAARPSVVALIPQYFVAFIALLYASGFLVVMAFLDRYGIRESGTELWKARYIHIGILALALPVIVNGTVFAIWYISKHPRADLNEHQMRQRLWPVLLLLVNFELVCFFMIMLTRGGQPGTPAVGIGPLEWILGVTFIGLVVVLLADRFATRFVKNFAKPEGTDGALATAHRFNTVLRWALVPAVAGLDIWFIVEFARHLTGVSIWLVALYSALSIGIGVLVGTTVVYAKRPTAPGNVVAYRAMMICLLPPFFYLMLLAFAYGVFPLIPAPRGGGDYTASPHVVVHFASPTGPLTKLSVYCDPTDSTRSKPLVLLEDSGNGIYVADPAEGGGPEEWRSVGGRKPRLLFLRRDELAAIEFESRSNSQRTP